MSTRLAPLRVRCLLVPLRVRAPPSRLAGHQAQAADDPSVHEVISLPEGFDVNKALEAPTAKEGAPATATYLRLEEMASFQV